MKQNFEAFYAAYPRHTARGAAEKAWLQAIKRAPPEQIIARAQAYASTGPDPKFTPHPSTWLNQDRWADEQPKDRGRELTEFLENGGKIPDAMF